MALSDAKLRNLRPAAKPQKFSDSDGLHVIVTSSGSKLWRLSYRFQGRQKTIALGKYPSVTLAMARQARDEARRLLKENKDPAHLRKVEAIRARVAAGHTFGQVAEEWFQHNEGRWVESYSSRLRSRLDDDLLPKLGHRPIADIEPLEVLDAIRAIERRGAVEMAKRIMQMASGVFRFGVATGRCLRDPTVDLRGALKKAGPPKARSALSAAELPEFLGKLDGYHGEPVTRLALKLVLLTFVRSAELRFATWNEFENVLGEEPIWRIPAGRMKMRRPHLVPLAPQAIEVLHELRRYSGRSAFVLPAATNTGVMSENTMIFALYRMGYHGRATVHGFRSTASTILNEHQFNSDWIEMQLAHSDNSVRGVYNAAQWLPGRRQMMQWWADYLDRATEQGRAPPPVQSAADPFGRTESRLSLHAAARQLPEPGNRRLRRLAGRR